MPKEALSIGIQIIKRFSLKYWVYREKKCYTEDGQKLKIIKNCINREAATTENMVELCETIW